MNELCETDRLVRSQSVLVTDIVGETCMMSIDNGRYYGLDEVGTRIWEILAEPTSSADVVACLLREYDVSETECRTQVKSFLDHLVQERLVVVDTSVSHLKERR